ncbi:MAG: glycosyltransferase family 2 protein [Verrucomicrobia bacterium]|nr:glycosyltransferase family 2 protein [Verrucomicrobiota bacterium]MDA1087226.1 glycosyltransferase family 2 protein [Verrucomicrobiota bacterium]
MAARANISILILTLNEEINLPDCLRSVDWSDDIVVLDSFSNDATEQIARDAGVRFYQRKLDDWSSHYNWALTQIEYKNDWVFTLDADERMTPELLAEMKNRLATDYGRGIAAYQVRFKNILWGRWIKRASLYPTWITRLYRPSCVHFEKRPVHPHPAIDGEIEKLDEHFIHCGFNKGLHHWFARHNDYSTMEMRACLSELRSGRIDWKGLRSVNPGAKRCALKNLSFRLPCRPVVKFLYYYVYRGAFLEGVPGFTYCVLQSTYEYMIVLKLREIKRREHGLPI